MELAGKVAVGTVTVCSGNEPETVVTTLAEARELRDGAKAAVIPANCQIYISSFFYCCNACYQVIDL